jgi:hypothetical protein
VHRGPLMFFLRLLSYPVVAVLGAAVGILLWDYKPLGLEPHDWLAWPGFGLAGGTALGLIIGLLTWFVGLVIGLLAWSGSSKKRAPNTVVPSFTPQSLAPFLSQMGYEFTTTKTPSGEPQYMVAFTRDGWNICICVSVSPNRTSLWLATSLGQVPHPVEEVAERLLRLLQGNVETAPVFFGCVRDGQYLTIQRAVDNRALTPALFRTMFDDFVGVLQRTAVLWNTANWLEGSYVQPSDRRGRPPSSDRFMSPSS